MKDRQTINEIMKSYKPWTVGVCTDRSDNAIFFPVGYDKKFNRWYGYVEQIIHGEIELDVAWRSGTTKRYKIKNTGNEILPKEDSIFIWIKRMTTK